MLKWTIDPPKEVGWYWLKLGEKGLTYVVEVFCYPYSLSKLVFNQPWEEGMTISVANAKKFYRPLWAGPIPEPEEE